MKQENKLRQVLKINAAFSTLSGLCFILMHGALGKLIGLHQHEILMYIGIGLLLFATSVFYEAFAKAVRAKQVKFIVIQDCLWVVGSIVIVIFHLFGLTFTGYLLISIIALIVAAFAFFQVRYLRN
ncbi:MAG: hypothetical protein AAGI07_13395 [Bacteroidota bacterium]